MRTYSYSLLIFTTLWVYKPDGDTTNSSNCIEINATDLYLEAVFEPELFDEYASTLSNKIQTIKCLRIQASSYFEKSRTRLQECNQVASNSTLWQGCQKDVEESLKWAAILTSMADAIEGKQRFDESSWGRYLIAIKKQSGPLYNSTRKITKQFLPELKCDVCNQ